MNTHADPIKKETSQSVSNEVSQHQGGAEPSSIFVDNRPEALAQKAMQALASNSNRVKQLQAFQDIANRNAHEEHIYPAPTASQSMMRDVQIDTKTLFVQKSKENFPIQQVAISGVIQRTPVQVEMNGATISNVNTATSDRPEGVMKGEEGSHTTAYSVFGEVIRQTLIGETFANAKRKMKALYKATKNLPGVARVQYLNEDRQNAYAAALVMLDNAKGWYENEQTIDNLQRYASAWIVYRNIIPLTAVKIGGNADSGGENLALGKLRDPGSNTSGDLKKAFLKLLDVKSLATMSEIAASDFEEDETYTKIDDAPEVSIDVPGVKDESDAEDSVIDSVNQFLSTVSSAFPQAFRKANLSKIEILAHLGLFLPAPSDKNKSGDKRSRAAVDEITSSKRRKVGKGKDEKKEIAVSADAITVHAGLDIPDTIGINQKDRPGNNPAAVQVMLDDKNKIVDVAISGSDRPKGLFGAADKKHATAYTVFVKGVEAQLKGKTINQGIVIVNKFFEDAKALPGNDLVEHLTKTRVGEFNTAKRDAEDCKGIAAISKTQVNLQSYIRAFLTYRNFIPMSAADIPGTGTGAKAEGRKIGIISNYKVKKPEAIKGAMWGLLDDGVVKAFGALTGMNQGTKNVTRSKSVPDRRKGKKKGATREVKWTVNPDLPGADLTGTAEKRMALVIAQHVLSLKSMHPDAYVKSGIGTQDSILSFLKKAKIANEKGRTKIWEIIEELT